MPSHTSYLVVNSVTIDGANQWITNLDAAMTTSATIVGANRPLHGGAVIRHKRYLTETRRQFNLVITGTSAANASANALTLATGLGIGSTSSDGSVTAVWHKWDGSTKTAAVHVLELAVGELNKRHLNAVLTLLVEPAGFV